MDTTTLIQELGLSEATAKTFEALVAESQGASVVTLSKQLNLPRPTLYGHLDELVARGLVKKGSSERGSVFHAESSAHILSLFDERARKLAVAKGKLKDVLSKERESHAYHPKFTVLGTKEVYGNIFRDVLRTKPRETYWFVSVKEMIKSIPPAVLEDFHRERARKNIKLKVLWPKKRTVSFSTHSFLGPAEEKESLREVRILPPAIDFPMAYGIFGNRVAFMSTRREHFGFIIDSRELAETHKNQFDYFWNIAQPYCAKNKKRRHK